MPAKDIKRRTIIEIAKEAGVSSATVSRVMNDTGYPVKEATRRRVEEVVKKNQFRLNAFGKGLSGKSNVIGVHVGAPLSVDPSFAQCAASVIDGIKSVTRDGGYHVFLSVQDSLAAESQVDKLFNIPLAGVLLLAPRNDDETIPMLNEWGVPFVIIGSSGFPGNSFADGDEEHAGHAAVRHLLRNGRTRIAFLASTDNYEPALARVRGYRDELKRQAVEASEDWLAHCPTSADAAFEAAVHMLALRNRPDSIFAYNDIMAVGVLKAARHLGFRVPEDLAVVGYDDSPICTLVDPQLTTFHHDDFGVAAAATRILLEKVIPGGPGAGPWNEIVKSRLIVRQSCGGRVESDDSDGPTPPPAPANTQQKTARRK